YIRSTRNTRIERLWVEVGTQFARRWRAFFTRLENHHMLDYQNPNHLWLLHSLFLDTVNADCLDFRREWNCHPISGPDTNNKSPNDLRFLGQTQFGVYGDDCEGVHPDVIDRYYGVHGEDRIRERCHSGAGHPADEEDSDDEEPTVVKAQVAELVSAHQQQYAYQDAVHVPSFKTPFVNPEDEVFFFEMLHEVIRQKIIPDGFRLTPAEWGMADYPIFESIQVGRRRTKQLDISLAGEIWYDRACLWGQALFCLTHFIEHTVQ
ncbi:hypothetical protein BKA82DRAFT_3988947, partial [Pisolithus tinctorius]